MLTTAMKLVAAPRDRMTERCAARAAAAGDQRGARGDPSGDLARHIVEPQHRGDPERVKRQVDRERLVSVERTGSRKRRYQRVHLRARRRCVVAGSRCCRRCGQSYSHLSSSPRKAK